MKSALLVALLALVCVAGVSARGDACNGNDFGTAGDFDFYVFAQSWPAQFCQAHQDWPGCKNPTNWQAHNLTLHGMWPNFKQSESGHGWPQCCQSSYGTNINVQIVQSMLTDLQTYWPNEQDPSGGDLSNSLWAHEWQKHGTCSGLDQKSYFQTAMNVQLSMPTPPAITNNIGGSVSLQELQKAFNATGCREGAACMAGFNCAAQNGQLYLSGVTTCWDQNMNQIACPPAVLSSQGKQCTQSNVYIQSY